MQELRQHDITTSTHVGNNVHVNRIWIDVEDEVPAIYYDADVPTNQKFLSEIVKALNDLHIPVGIYSTKTYWENIMGNILGYGIYPLW